LTQRFVYNLQKKFNGDGFCSMAFAPNFFAAVRNCPGTDQKLTGLAGEINVDASVIR